MKRAFVRTMLSGSKSDRIALANRFVTGTTYRSPLPKGSQVAEPDLGALSVAHLHPADGMSNGE
ncbi:MAG TPA: hypothetical protein VIS99_13025 [Terrimicrobiaceae bacterium]